MDEGNLKSVRDIIILSCSADDTGLNFDTSMALNKGFSEADLEEADKIIIASPTRTLKTAFLIEDLKNTIGIEEFNHWTYYIEPVGLIILTHKENFTSIYLFEEDLITDVVNKNKTQLDVGK